MRTPITGALFLLTLFCVFAAPSRAEALLCSPITGCSCTVNVSDLAFGNLQPLNNTAATGTADVHVQCTGVIDVLPAVLAQVNGGTHGTIAARRMRDGANYLDYNLYTTDLHGTIVGMGTGGYPALLISGGLLSLGSWNATGHIYGRIPPTPSARPGSYTDTVVVRIEW